MAKFTKIVNLDELIRGRIEGEVVEQTVTSLLPPGENFGSVMYKVDFKVQRPGSKEEEEHHAVAKCTPLNKVTQEIFNTQVTFKSEIGWYTTVIPTLRRFQKEKGIDEDLDYFQSFYGARISLDPGSEVVDEDGVILTQNLKDLGYFNVDRHVGFNTTQAKAVLRALASFHAIPIAIKLQNRELFDTKIKPYLPNLKMMESPEGEANPFTELLDRISEIDSIAQYSDRVVSNVKNFKIFIDDSETNEPWGSICHNDFWMNNIMINGDDEPKVIILDLQCPCYGSIALDLVFFLSTSVALDDIRDKMDDFIQYYWREFIKNLERLGVDTTLFPYDGFLKELELAGSRGQFGHAVMHTMIILTEKGQTTFDSSDAEFKLESFNKTKLVLTENHKEKYKWLVTEFAKRNWI
ncbi:uncharacterized protein LOC143204457 [Rhynchophorus ferrugineus]|uniref:uncharacterized protein LOC143204457 n=1 Tax=Rhynchophorus ferrugineus TaxID=354439 RepID=UPI003FCDFF52